mmetsp:Transcript_39959/g.93794  ORF Transcript_39959/g.93794 Transcript_39959/m.93794 type:complete len:81 (+) Transcript_39959:968-1210(+)
MYALNGSLDLEMKCRVVTEARKTKNVITMTKIKRNISSWDKSPEIAFRRENDTFYYCTHVYPQLKRVHKGGSDLSMQVLN